MANSEMGMVLEKLHLNNLFSNFILQKIAPDIIYLLSSRELQELGVTDRENMVKLWNECVRYGIQKPSIVSLQHLIFQNA
jgi:hypothetical protein